MTCFRLIPFFLLPILVIGCSLRIVGIGIGLPDYPDPREQLIARDILNLIHLESLPAIYNWPGTAWFYLIAGIGKILQQFDLNPTVSRVIWLARFTNVLLSTATIWLTYQVGIRFYSRSTGLIGSGFLAVAMLHATNELRFALVDIPATFCVTFLLWLCTKTQSVSIRRAVWIGVIAGISFAVKFTTVFAGLSVVTLFLRKQYWSNARLISWFPGLILKLMTVIGAAVATFTIICPYWLMDLFSSEWNLFFDAFFYEALHYRQGHFGLFATGEVNWINRFTHLWTLLRWGLGIPLALLAVVGISLAIMERRDGDKILLALVLPYLLFIGSHKLKFARHLLLLYPALTLLAAASISHLEKIHDIWGLRIRTNRVKGFAIAIVGIVGGYSLIYTAAFAGIMATQPTMAEAAKWIESNIPPNEAIEREPEILFNWLSPKLNRGFNDADAKWALVLMPNAEIFLNYAARPEIYSEIDWYPIEEIDLETSIEFYNRILADAGGYKLVQTFQRHPRFLGISISDQGAPFPIRALAHPEIRIYHLHE